MSVGDRRSGGLVLVGYRGTGKTTVGRILADRLGLPFVDADAELEARAGRPIARIFDERGEAGFREEEAALIEELGGRMGLVLATGGGAVLRESNRRVLRRLGTVVWLTAEPAAIVARLRDDPAGRPALTPMGLLDEVASVLERRRALYREVADFEVATDGLTPGEIAEAVRTRLGLAPGGGT
jgi:shikimate kinase